MPTATTQQLKKLNFRDDTLTTASRDVLSDEFIVEPDTEKFIPLTQSQHHAVAKAEPKENGKVIASLL